jgi:hypothetical protein
MSKVLTADSASVPLLGETPPLSYYNYKIKKHLMSKKDKDCHDSSIGSSRTLVLVGLMILQREVSSSLAIWYHWEIPVDSLSVRSPFAPYYQVKAVYVS